MPVHRHYGWLFGLTGHQESRIREDRFEIRLISPQERSMLLSYAASSLYADPQIWANLMDHFPYLYELTVEQENGFYSPGDGIAFMLSLLNPGEIRAPIQLSTDDKGGGSGSIGMSLLDYYNRYVNSRYQTVSIESIEPTVTLAYRKLKRLAHSHPYEILGPVLADRFLACKGSIIQGKIDLPPENTVTRCADVVMMLEYLFHEGATSEVLFRLGQSIAWILGTDPESRLAIIDSIKKAYTLRSKHVHGSKITQKDGNSVDAALEADLLLRRVLAARILTNTNDNSWVQMVKRARVGDLPEDFDPISWITNPENTER